MKVHQKLLYIGQLLKDKRQLKGLSLKQVSQKTCIGTPLLQAIEEGHIEQLPAYIYLRGFILAYAKTVDLKTKDIVKEIKLLHPSPESLTKFASHPASAEESMVETELHLMPVVVAVCILFVLGGVLIFFNTFTEKKDKIDTKKEVLDSKTISQSIREQTATSDQVGHPTEKSKSSDLNSSFLPVEVVVKALKTTHLSYQIDDEPVKNLSIKKNHFEVFKAKTKILIRSQKSDQIQVFHNGLNLGSLGSGGFKESVFSKTRRI